MAQALDGPIVQVDVRYFHSVLQAIRVYGIAMILRRNRDASGCQIFDGMVAAPVSEFQLERLTAKNVAEDLVAEADSHDRFFADEVPHSIHDIAQLGRITRPRREH